MNNIFNIIIYVVQFLIKKTLWYQKGFKNWTIFINDVNVIMSDNCMYCIFLWIHSRCCQKERSGKQHQEKIKKVFMNAFEGNEVRNHWMENVAGCSKLMDRHILSNFFIK